MLAKLWKKALLAICIIACIFNIMSKLVNRHSLKENLESANDGETVFSIFQKEKVVESESKPIIDGVKTPEQSTTEETSKNVESNVTIEVENTTVEEVVAEPENIEENSTTDTTPEESVVEETTKENKDEKKPFKFSDFTILF